VSANCGKVPISRQQNRAGVARGERDQAIVLESSQSDAFVIGKYFGQESAGVIPTAAPRRRIQRQELRDQGFHTVAIGTSNAPAAAR